MMRIASKFCFLSALAVLSAVPAAHAGETICDGTLSAGTFDNIIVLAGDSCTLTGTVEVEGNVKADFAADLIVSGALGDPIEIGGNIDVKESENVRIVRADVDGNIKVEKCVIPDEDSNRIVVDRTIVGGNIDIMKNEVSTDGNTIDVFRNELAGNLTVQKNISNDRIRVNVNTVSGNLEVKKNVADDQIEVAENEVDGNFGFEKNETNAEIGVFDSGNLDIDENTVGGNIDVTRNASVGDRGDLLIQDNRADQHLLVVKNTATDDIEVADNNVAGDLVCKKNDPDPTGTGSNTVGGNLDCDD